MVTGANGALLYFVNELGLKNPRLDITKENFLGINGNVLFLTFPYLKSLLNKAKDKGIYVDSTECEYPLFPTEDDPLGVSLYYQSQSNFQELSEIQQKMLTLSKELSAQYQPSVTAIDQKKHWGWKRIRIGEKNLRQYERSNLWHKFKHELTETLSPEFERLSSFLNQQNIEIAPGYTATISFYSIPVMGGLQTNSSYDSPRPAWFPILGIFTTKLTAVPSNGIPDHPLIDGLAENIRRIKIAVPAKDPAIKIILENPSADIKYEIYTKQDAEFSDELLREVKDLLLL